jgi:hypothetical protein
MNYISECDPPESVFPVVGRQTGNLPLQTNIQCLASAMSKTLVLLLALVSAATLSARTLTSSCGKKTMEAEVVDYNPATGKVVIRNEGSIRNTIVDATAFSAKDQEYFNEFLKEAARRKSLDISAEKQSEKEDETQRGSYIYDKRKESFNIKIANTSATEIKGLLAKFDIYVSKYDKEGKKIVAVVSGQESIASIAGDYTHEFTSPVVLITTGCATTSSCPKCKQHASSVKSERVIGIYVRLLDSNGGDLLTEYYSSSSVKIAAEKKAREAAPKVKKSDW